MGHRNRRDRSRGRRGYHHGNLREALIDAALDLIAEKGPGGFTFADAARSAGVSPAAPYRHFRDRDALVADVAKRGFTLLTEDLVRASEAGDPKPIRRLEQIGQAYIEFARREPALFSAMFESGQSYEAPEVRAAEERAFSVLVEASQALVDTVSDGGRPPATMIALHIFSLAHGIAALYARGDASRRKIPMAPSELLEAAILIYLEGLGVSS